jgi:hypothetical protein
MGQIELAAKAKFAIAIGWLSCPKPALIIAPLGGAVPKPLGQRW